MAESMNSKSQQQFFNAAMLATYEFNPKSMLESEQFPDILNHLSTEQIRMLFELLAQPVYSHLVNKKGPLGGYTALHWMAIKNELELIEFLVTRCRADVNCQANLGETPLLICIKNSNLYTIDFLIEHGANLECRDSYNRSVVHWCAYTGKVVLLHYFQKYHAISNYNDLDQFQQSALHIACGSGFVDMIKYLIERDLVDLFTKDFNGNTCLHLAAKCGLSRTCWLITQEKNGEAAKLITIKNNSGQTPYEFIRNERGLNYQKIKNWLRLEIKTNKWLIDDKRSRFQLSTFWNSHIYMKSERALRFAAFFLVLAIPALINQFLIYPNEMSQFKGIVGYSTFILMGFVISKQKHRIEHISGLQNPFFLGYFSSLFVHNYFAFYFYVIEEFDVFSLYTLTLLALTFWHFYTYYKIITVEPGFCKESIKKKDGTPYDLKDLMALHAGEQNCFRDSVSLMIEPSLTASIDGGQTNALFLCEHCLMVQSIPTKHCKLCERCCAKFDHHCLYINSCVGVNNHRVFIYFLISSIICTSIFLYSLYSYFSTYSAELAEYNRNKSIEDQMNMIYVLFSSGLHIWLFVLFLVNGVSIFMVVFLFLYQIKFISLGFTSQFPPPIAFVQSHKRMATFLSACFHRMDNLYTFFFESCESNEELYFRQQSEYRNSVSSKAIALPYPYPRNNFDEAAARLANGFEAPMKTTTSITTISMNTPLDPNMQQSRSLLAEKTIAANKNEFEIDLD